MGTLKYAKEVIRKTMESQSIGGGGLNNKISESKRNIDNMSLLLGSQMDV